MDFEKMLDEYKNMTCIISVDRTEDGSYGNIRVVAGNKAHCDESERVMGHPFVPDRPYEESLMKDKNFEDFCYRSAILGQSLHTYVSLHQMGLWLNLFLLPLKSDEENRGYCLYSYDVAPQAAADQLSKLSADTSADVIKTCIKLRGSDNTAQAFYDVIEDIRQICDSDHCCILLTDPAERRCITLCEAIRPGCGLLPMDTYLDENFYDIAATWKDTIGSSTCVIVKDENDMKWLEKINPVWHYSLTQAGARSIVLFPLNYNGETLGYVVDKLQRGEYGQDQGDP